MGQKVIGLKWEAGTDVFWFCLFGVGFVVFWFFLNYNILPVLEAKII